MPPEQPADAPPGPPELPEYGIPVIGLASPELAAEVLALADAGARLHLDVKTVSETRTTVNVLADTPDDSDPDDRNVVVAGAHIDSVPGVAGLNDNATSAAALLAIAEKLPKLGPTANTVRFAFWGAEEPGFLGSRFYVDQLSESDRDGIALNLNFEMLGSPNGVRFVADGDNSIVPAGPDVLPGSPASGIVEDVFAGYFAGRGLPTEPVGLLNRSDHVPFAAAGIPVGALFGGAEGRKTEQQAQVHGGTPGEPYDPCYHHACDTIGNLDLTLLDQFTDGAAFAVERFAADVADVRKAAKS